ncbi:MAG: cysteine desulfurase family protein [Bacteroidota bacterium]
MSQYTYLDNNSTTPLDPRVLDAMMPYLTDIYSNAASNHTFGKASHDAVQKAREEVADLIGARTREIIFTSGATEGINLAMKGVADKYQTKGKHIITVATEHSAVLDTGKYLAQQGFEVEYLAVKEDGLLELEVVKAALRPDTILLSVMMVNNETGVIQPIKELAALAHEAGALFMTDATQAVGKMPLNVEQLGIDLMPFSAHKFYGPKGVGGLYVRSQGPHKVKLNALQHGGGHERGMRSGTLNTPGIVGLGAAANIAKKDMDKDAQGIKAIRDRLEKELLKIPNSFINGSVDHRLYNTSNICFQGVDADAVIVGLENISVSSGSACTAVSVDPSHVLVAMGRTEAEAYGSLRFSLGRMNTDKVLDELIPKITETIQKLRQMV